MQEHRILWVSSIFRIMISWHPFWYLDTLLRIPWHPLTRLRKTWRQLLLFSSIGCIYGKTSLAFLSSFLPLIFFSFFFSNSLPIFSSHFFSHFFPSFSFLIFSPHFLFLFFFLFASLNKKPWEEMGEEMIEEKKCEWSTLKRGRCKSKLWIFIG